MAGRLWQRSKFGSYWGVFETYPEGWRDGRVRSVAEVSVIYTVGGLLYLLRQTSAAEEDQARRPYQSGSADDHQLLG